MRKFLLVLTALAAVHAAVADDYDTLQSLISRAVAQKQSKLLIPKAVYRLDRSFLLKDLRNLEIDGGGSIIVFTDPKVGVQVFGCDNLTLANFTTDYAPLPFTQGTILQIEPEKARMRIQLHAGYPGFPRIDRINVHIFDPVNRNWKNGAPDYFGRTLTAAGTGCFYVEMPPGFEKYVAVGDLAAFDWRSGYGFEIKGSRDFRLRDVTILTAPGLAILGRFSTGKHHFERVNITRGPIPVGAVEARLLSSAADGINYAYGENGPDIIGCDFSYIGDDSINFHSVAMPVVKVESPTSILVVRPYPREGFPDVIRRGMELRLMDGRDFRVLEKGQVASFETAKDFEVPIVDMTALFHNFRPEKDSSRTVYRIKLENPLPVKKGQFIDIPAICGANYVIRDNYFHDHRARAIRMMASNGVIENNRIERIKQNAITIGGEYSFWREAGWVENLIVRNNVIKDVGLDERITSAKSYAPGAISLIMRPEDGVLRFPSGNSNIVIEGNSIDGCSGVGIVMHAVDGATVRNNTIRKVGYGNLAEAGKAYGFKISNPIELTPSAVNVKMENNILEK